MRGGWENQGRRKWNVSIKILAHDCDYRQEKLKKKHGLVSSVPLPQYGTKPVF